AGTLDVGASPGEVAVGDGEAGEAEVGVARVEAEAAAGGEGEDLVEVLPGEVEGAVVGVEGGAGEEGAGEVLVMAGATEGVDGGGDVGGGRGELEGGAVQGGEEVGAAEGEVLERGVEGRGVRQAPREEARGARAHLDVPALIEQEVAVEVARDRGEHLQGRIGGRIRPFGQL